MIGTRISAYEVLSELGSGGMGSVYLAECAEDAAGLEEHTKVALKVIHPNLLSQPGFFKRFLREAQIGQEVQHENVVRTYDCDATDVDGAAAHFLVMEYVEGQTLRDLLEELERVPEELCRHIGLEVAKGLAAIHEAGVVHRDIKPENVLITEEHVVKVMDLGVARLADEAIRLSQTGSFVGSLEYAAPEQFRTSDGEPDGRADLHSLGVVLYELATGQHPYRDEDASKVLRNILDVEPRKAGEINPQLSPFFEEVVQTLIAKDRDARFADADSLAGVFEDGEKSDWWRERAKALRLQTKRPLRRIRIPRETALYGRDDDLAKLQALFDKSKAGDGQVLLIEGEAGIGKTRLVDEFVGRLRQEGEDINFLFGSYPPGGAATAAGAFSEAYREQFGEEGLEETLAEYVTPTPILIPAFAAILKGETTPTDAEALTKDSLQTVFVHATRGLAAERTTVVLIDDLHFAPEDGRALFSSLAMACPGHRIMLVGTMRPGVSEEWTASITRLDHAEHRALSRLGPKDLAKLLGDAFRSERLAEELAYQIGVKSDGNPFFAFEIIRGLREGQFIGQDPDGTWVTTRVIEDIKVPSSVLDLVKARMAGLNQVERDLLDVATCFGFEFDPAMLASVVGLGRVPVLKRLAQIERAHRLVRSSGRRFIFDHHQVQEAIYESLPEMLREEYHAAIADAVEAREKTADQDPKELDGALCVELSEHFLKGARGDSALRYLDAALDHLEAGYLSDQAIHLAYRALAVSGLLDGKERVEILLRLNKPLALLGRREAQETLFEEAIVRAEKTEDPALEARVRNARGALLESTSRYEPARIEYEAALALARRATEKDQEAWALGGLGSVFGYLSRYEEAVSHVEQSLSICREIGDENGAAKATGSLGTVFYRQGRNEEAREQFERVIEIARALGDRALECSPIGNLGGVFFSQGRFEEGRAQFERAVETFREVGDRSNEASCAVNLATAYSVRGRSAEALKHFQSARAVCREVGNRQGEAVTLCNEGRDLTPLGAQGAAQARTQAALEIAREIGYRLFEAIILTVQAGGLDQQADAEAAEGLHQEALKHFEDMGTRGEHAASAHLRYGVFLARLGRTDEARKHLDEALALATESGAPSERVLSVVHLALLDGGDLAEAAQALRDDAKRLEHGSRMEVNFLLYKATGDQQYVEAAHDLLTFWVEHAPEEYRESMLKNVRLNREIMEAWEEFGVKGATEAKQ